MFTAFRLWRTLKHTQWQEQLKCPRVRFKEQKQINVFLMCTTGCNDLTCPSELIETGYVSALQGTMVTTPDSSAVPDNSTGPALVMSVIALLLYFWHSSLRNLGMQSISKVTTEIYIYIYIYTHTRYYWLGFVRYDSTSYDLSIDACDTIP